eukprot:5159789-Pyramimonas_sp.AAC.1
MDSLRFEGMPTDSSGCAWIPRDSQGFLRIPMDSHGFLKIPRDSEIMKYLAIIRGCPKDFARGLPGSRRDA